MLYTKTSTLTSPNFWVKRIKAGTDVKVEVFKNSENYVVKVFIWAYLTIIIYIHNKRRSNILTFNIFFNRPLWCERFGRLSHLFVLWNEKFFESNKWLFFRSSNWQCCNLRMFTCTFIKSEKKIKKSKKNKKTLLSRYENFRAGGDVIIEWPLLGRAWR